MLKWLLLFSQPFSKNLFYLYRFRFEKSTIPDSLRQILLFNWAYYRYSPCFVIMYPCREEYRKTSITVAYWSRQYNASIALFIWLPHCRWNISIFYATKPTNIFRRDLIFFMPPFSESHNRYELPFHKFMYRTRFTKIRTIAVFVDLLVSISLPTSVKYGSA